MRLTMTPDTASAVVEIVVEVQTAAWGPDCTIAQAVEQAMREAENKITNALSDTSGVRVLKAAAVRVVCPAKR